MTKIGGFHGKINIYFYFMIMKYVTLISHSESLSKTLYDIVYSCFNDNNKNKKIIHLNGNEYSFVYLHK